MDLEKNEEDENIGCVGWFILATIAITILAVLSFNFRISDSKVSPCKRYADDREIVGHLTEVWSDESKTIERISMSCTTNHTVCYVVSNKFGTTGISCF